MRQQALIFNSILCCGNLSERSSAVGLLAVVYAEHRLLGSYAMETATIMAAQAGQGDQPLNANILVDLIAGAVDSLERDRASTRTLLEQAIAILRKDSPATRQTAPAARQLSLAPWQAKKVTNHISAHLDRPITLRELAEVARLSSSHFSRAFKGAFGQPPHMFIMNQRVELAMRKMLDSSEPLSQIALSCGFSDQAHLARLFRRETGVAPSQWRRANQAPLDQRRAA